METIKWENANALEIGMLMEMAEDGYVFCIEDGRCRLLKSDFQLAWKGGHYVL